jgi:hypothetical protein
MSLLVNMVALALALGVAWLAVRTAGGPLAAWSGIWRFVAFLVVAYFAQGVFASVLGLIGPALDGNASFPEVLALIGGIALVVALVLVYQRLSGNRESSTV